MKFSLGKSSLLLLDVLSVVVFVLIGRSAHGHHESVAGIAATAFPFLTGTLLGWLASRAWKSPMEVFPTGMIVWIATVIVGQAVRLIVGQGSTFLFLMVSLAFLCIPILGWRVIASLFNRRVNIFRTKS